MPGCNDIGIISVTTGAALGAHLRVILTAGVAQLAGITDRELGTMEEASFASGEVKAERLRNTHGTRKMIANAAMAVGAQAYTAASGKIGASASTAYREGILLTASAADGDIVEVATDPDGGTVVP
jgi:type IV secretory pathway VirB6-like protein